MPWWVGLVLATLSYLTLHHFPTSPPNLPDSVQPGDMSQLVIKQIFTGAAMVAQYVFPYFSFLSSHVIEATKSELPLQTQSFKKWEKLSWLFKCQFTFFQKKMVK